MGKKVVILQSNYIPWKGYFELINNADVFCFYDEVQYTKNDWRNRNKILGPNGLFWITIPVNKDAVNGKISEAQINDGSWQKKHFKTIEQTYSKSINKNEVLALLEPIYIGKEWESISKLNQHLIITISEYMGLSTEFKNSSDYNLSGNKIDRLISLIKQLEGTEYISGKAAKNYLSESEQLFEENQIKLNYKDYGPYLKYNNGNKEFEDYVSILDLIMNVKKEEYMIYLNSCEQ